METAILIMNRVPVKHCSIENYLELYEYMFEGRAPFREMDPRYFADIGTMDKFREYFRVHAGIDSSPIDLYDKDGEYLDAYILTNPFYIFELDKDVAEAVRQYCLDNGIEIKE